MILHAVDAMEKEVGPSNSSFGNSNNYTMSSDPSVPIVVDNGTGVSLDHPSKSGIMKLKLNVSSSSSKSDMQDPTFQNMVMPD